MIQKELSQRSIKAAILNRHCPHCKRRAFLAMRVVVQDLFFSGKTAWWGLIHSSAKPQKVTCEHCGFEIPKQVWENWEIP